jgi:hypothetical protein
MNKREIDIIVSLLLAPNTQLIFKRFTESQVTFRHVPSYFAMLEERQDPFDVSGTLYGLASFCALRHSNRIFWIRFVKSRHCSPIT